MLCNFLKDETNCSKAKDAITLLKTFDLILEYGNLSIDDNKVKDNIYRNKIMSYGATPFLEALQNHPEDSVYDATTAIIEKYFSYV